ncbi:MmgE/PrpD family protein [Pectobacteriaceae bacterium C52]|nr:MmgE/PrpD family protein [Pectobacteriaceae bacterium C52]
MMNSVQMQLAWFIHDTCFSDIPPALVERCKRHILDTLGAALAGVDSDVWQTTFHIVEADGAAPRAQVWGSICRTSARNAALLNGIAAHMYELDDTGGCDHSGAVVVPAALAVLPLCPQPVSGQQLITAVMLGYDVGRRVLEACGGYSAHNGKGWHSTATCGVFGAAAAAAYLLQLTPAQTSAALGIAGSFSGGLWAFIHDGSQSKKLHAGRAAEGGVLAAQLAAGQVSGPQKLFDDVWGGFLATLAGQDAQPEALTDGLGDVWKLARCSIKPYASCRGVHSAIDAVGILMTSMDISMNDVASIDVSLSRFLHGMCGGCDLDSLAAAQMSLPYALAARLIHGHAGLSAYSVDKRHDPDIQRLLSRITLHIDDQQDDDSEPLLTLTTYRGARQQHRVGIPLGAPTNPLSDADLLVKFTTLATRVVSEQQAQSVISFCLALEQETDCRMLTSLLSC